MSACVIDGSWPDLFVEQLVPTTRVVIAALEKEGPVYVEGVTIIADIFKECWPKVVKRRRVARAERRVAEAIMTCRTRLIGCPGPCGTCGRDRRLLKQSCDSSYCSQCSGPARREWTIARASDVLPVEYALVTFKLPKGLRVLADYNRSRLFDILFDVASAGVATAAIRSRGVRVGFLAVLQTWTETLIFDPHVHLIMPLGGLSRKGATWLSLSSDFLAEEEAEDRFRDEFSIKLREAHACARLMLPDDVEQLHRSSCFNDHVRRSLDDFRGPHIVAGEAANMIKYLAKNYPRVPISDDRIVSFEQGMVVISVRGGTRQLHGVTFVERYLKHILPLRYRAVRSYGLLASRAKAIALPRCRELLATHHPRVDLPMTSEVEKCGGCYRPLPTPASALN